MSEEARDPLSGSKLVQILLLEAAYRMEDSAPVLVRMWPADRTEQMTRIAFLTSVAGDLAALANAASALHQRSSEPASVPL